MPDAATIPFPAPSAPAKPQALLLTQREAWTFLGLSRSAWFRLRGEGKLPKPVSPDGALLWRRVDLERWVERLRAAR